MDTFGNIVFILFFVAILLGLSPFFLIIFYLPFLLAYKLGNLRAKIIADKINNLAEMINAIQKPVLIIGAILLIIWLVLDVQIFKSK